MIDFSTCSAETSHFKPSNKPRDNTLQLTFIFQFSDFICQSNTIFVHQLSSLSVCCHQTTFQFIIIFLIANILPVTSQFEITLSQVNS